MTGRFYGLLVGIDAYPGPVPPLAGCVNDVEAFERLLRARVGTAGVAPELDVLRNGQATRREVIQRFRGAFDGAGDGDTAVFYFAGHGSQEPAAPAHLVAEPDGWNETLVLADSRLAGGYDLVDKELAVLVGEVSARGVHVLVVLDCCHAGSGVRDLPGAGSTVRRTSAVRTHRPESAYLPGASGVARPARYVLLGACRSDQSAREVGTGPSARGALSVALETAVAASPGRLTYAQLHRAVVAAVAGVVAEQTPVLECSVPRDAARPVLGGAAVTVAPLFTASRALSGWRLDAGTLHGLPDADAGGRGTGLTLHGLTETDLDATTAVADAVTRTVRTVSADLDVVDGEAALDRRCTYRAVIRDLPLAVVTVAPDSDLPGLSALVEALGAAPGVTVREPGAATATDLRLHAAEGMLHMSRPGASRSLVAARALSASGVPWSAQDLYAVVAEVVHVGMWLGLWRRRNPTTRIAPGGLVLDLLDPSGRQVASPDGAVRVAQGLDERAAWLRIRVRNRSGRRLHVAVLALSELYGVASLPLGGGEWLDDGQELIVPGDGPAGREVGFWVEEPERITTDLIKVIASSERFDATSLEQEDLALPDVGHPLRGASGAGRAVGARRPRRAPEHPDDWTTREVLVTTVRAGVAVAVPTPGATVELDGGTRLLGHRGLRATAGLAVAATLGRSGRGAPPRPQEPRTFPFSFLPTRCPGGEVDVLVLDGVSNPAAVTHQDPLVLLVPQRLAAGELVLALPWDGVERRPVGSGRTIGSMTEIRIERLPNLDSVDGVRIHFRRVVGGV